MTLPKAVVKRVLSEHAGGMRVSGPALERQCRRPRSIWPASRVPRTQSARDNKRKTLMDADIAERAQPGAASRRGRAPRRSQREGPGVETDSGALRFQCSAGYIIPGMPPPPPGIAGSSFFGFSATIASVVSSSDATLAAFWSAVRTTLVGSITPAFTRSS